MSKSGFASAATILTVLTLLFTGGTPPETPFAAPPENPLTIDIEIQSTVTPIFSTEPQTLTYTYAGIGDDYLVYYNNGSPEVWLNSALLAKFGAWGKTAHIGFAFASSPGPHVFSVYDEAKMDRVIEILAANGIKSILCLSNIADMGSYVGSANFLAEWAAVATHYTGDTRIAGFHLIDEPTPYTWAPAVTDAVDLHQALAACIAAIRAVDATRTIFYPCFYGIVPGYGFPFSWAQFKAEYDANVGYTNVIFDIAHPYYWENAGMDVVTNPTGMVAWFKTYVFDPPIAYWGAANLWVGGSFPWGDSQGNYTPSVQITFYTALLNLCATSQVPLSVIAYLTTDHAWEYDQALAASTYDPSVADEEPPITPPPAQVCYVTLTGSSGGSINPVAGTYPVLVNQSFAVTATPAADYTVEWYRNTLLVSTAYTYNFIGLTAGNYSLAATFVYHAPVEPPLPPVPPATSFSVNIGVSVGGSTNVVGVQNVLTTGSLSVTATAATNHVFSYYLKDNANVGSTNPIVITGVASQTITLLPIFTYVPPSPPSNPPVSPGVVPIVTSGYWTQVLTVLESQDVPTFAEVIAQLENEEL